MQQDRLKLWLRDLGGLGGWEKTQESGRPRTSGSGGKEKGLQRAAVEEGKPAVKESRSQASQPRTSLVQLPCLRDTIP